MCRAVKKMVFRFMEFTILLCNFDGRSKEEAASCIANIQKAGLGKDVIVFFDFEYDTVKKPQSKASR